MYRFVLKLVYTYIVKDYYNNVCPNYLSKLYLRKCDTDDIRVLSSNMFCL